MIGTGSPSRLVVHPRDRRLLRSVVHRVIDAEATGTQPGAVKLIPSVVARGHPAE
jgi:hypothetical protein